MAMLLLCVFLLALLGGLLLGLVLPAGGEQRRGGGLSTVRQSRAAGSAEVREVAPSAATRPAQAKPATWESARGAYESGDYELAARHYAGLLALSESLPAHAAVSAFFRFRLGRCLARLGRLEQAKSLLGGLAESNRPVLRAAANYELAVLAYLAGDHLPARARAYSAVAACRAMQNPPPLEGDCDHLVARALTEKLLGFHQVPFPIPLSQKWQETDIFSGLDEKALRRRLNEDRDSTGRRAVGVRIGKAPSPGATYRYAASCAAEPLEQLLQRLAVETGVEIQWASVDPRVRQRIVTVAFRSAAAQRICEVACGLAGLVARFTGDRMIVHDPQSCESLSAQRDLLYQEATSTWRRFFLRHPEDERLAEGHFAVAALHECSADVLAAMKEYRLVARRYPREAVARSALLRTARLRIGLRDYAGARSDLLELLNRYPNCESLDEVYLRLGRASMNAGLVEEAVRVFEKLYHLDLSASSRKQACLGAAQCCYGKAAYKQACVWVSRYLRLSAGAPGDEVAEAYLTMGKSLAAVGDMPEAARALHCALRADCSAAQRTKVLLALAVVQKQRSRFVQALGALGKVDLSSLTPAQRCDYLLTAAGVYRAMGLGHKAVALVRKEMPPSAEEAPKLLVALELARCHIGEGDLGSARGVLVEVLPKMKSGPAAAEAAATLGRICLEMGNSAEAIAVGEELLRSGGPDKRREALQLLGQAYLQQGKHEHAALAFAGMPPEQAGADEK